MPVPSWRRHCTLFAAVLLLQLGAWATPAAAETERAERKAAARECRDLRRSFSQGLRHFERGEWPQAVAKMRGSLAGHCEKGASVVVPYGRWVYGYTPGVYLGVALSNAAGCSEEVCLKPVDWWSDLNDEEARGLIECAACSRAGGPGNCKLGLHWWHDLARTGQSVDKVRDYGEDCSGLSDVFTRVFTRKDPKVGTCNALVSELNQTLDACRQVHGWVTGGG